MWNWVDWLICIGFCIAVTVAIWADELIAIWA